VPGDQQRQLVLSKLAKALVSLFLGAGAATTKLLLTAT
jgi:hypothetical protein